MPTLSKLVFSALIFLCIFFNANNSLAIESRSTREAIVSPRTKKFYKGSRAKQYLSLTGNYSSDNNSRNYQATSRYLYQSANFIHEFNFDHEVKYADVGSGKKKQFDIKTSELYDTTFASKARILASNFYGVLYHRTIYDDMSSFYYDNRTATGFGYIFFKDKLEVDLSTSNHVMKNLGSEIDYILSTRLNYKFWENFTLNQRSYFFIDRYSLDNEFKTSLIYRLNQKLSFEIRHNFENRRYRDAPHKPLINNVSRSINVGFVFDLGGSG